MWVGTHVCLPRDGLGFFLRGWVWGVGYGGNARMDVKELQIWQKEDRVSSESRGRGEGWVEGSWVRDRR